MTRPLLPLAHGLLLSALIVTGCGDGDEPPHADEPMLGAPVPLPECPDENYERCDVRDAGCLKRLSRLAACLRQSEPLNVPVELLTEDAYREQLRQQAADAKPITPHFNRALSSLGLAPPEPPSLAAQIDDYVRDLHGFYDTTDKRIVIIDHGKPTDGAATDAVLVHELIHSLQDSDYDLAHFPDDEPRSFDAALARATLVEGEASLYQYRAAAALFGLDIGEVDLESALQRQLERSLEDALQALSALPASFRTVPYGMGALRAFSAWQRGGPRGVDGLWAAPPHTMQSVMAELFGSNEPQDSGRNVAPPVVDELSLDSDEVLGAFCLYLMRAQHGAADPLASALSWRGDHLWVWTASGSAATYALWQLEFDSAAAARDWQQFFDSSTLRPNRQGVSPFFVSEADRDRVYVSYQYGEGPAAEPLTAWGQAWIAESR